MEKSLVLSQIMFLNFSIVFSQANIDLYKPVSTSTAAVKVFYPKLLFNFNNSIIWNTPNCASVYSINELAAGALSAVSAVSSLSILPKKDFILLGYTSPRILFINNSLIDHKNQTANFISLAISWVGHNKKHADI